MKNAKPAHIKSILHQQPATKDAGKQNGSGFVLEMSSKDEVQ